MRSLKKLHQRIDQQCKKETMFLETKIQHRITIIVRRAVKEQLLKKYKQVEKAKLELRPFIATFERIPAFNKIDEVFDDIYDIKE